MIAFAGELALVRDLADAMRTPPLRTLSQFAEDEIVLPDGPYQGRRLKLDRHPAGRLLFRELEKGCWRRAFITGPNQDGKSLLGFVVPTIYLLFERRETVILGVPDINMVADKWRRNLLPVIKASKYKDLIPTSGSGSRGGDSVLFEFRNGSALRFMTSGGKDQARAGFTTPNLVVSETDGFDEVGGNSREGDKFSQLERRTLAFAERARLIAECTVGIESGRTWREIKHGSNSRIALPCPHCKAWVTPGREHFVGWQTASTEMEAMASAHLVCPECGSPWATDEWIEANRGAVLVHKGQEVSPAGTVIGDMPQTETLGFRWTVANSVLNPKRLAMVGGIEWKAQRAPDEEIAERDVLQSQWAMPSKPTRIEMSPLDYALIMQRTVKGLARGICPPDSTITTVGIDVGKWLLHWDSLAWRPNATPHTPNYGTQEVRSSIMSEEQAILTALRALRDEVLIPGLQLGSGRVQPTLVFVDAGYKDSPVHQFCRESGANFFAVKGFGVLQRRTGSHTRDTGSKVVQHGDRYAVVQFPSGDNLIEINVDAWKSWLHARLQTPVGQPGAFTLFDPNVSPAAETGLTPKTTLQGNVEHLSYAKHLTAEKQVEDWDPKEGTIVRWEAVSRNNHYLDATMLACVAGHAAGMRLMGSEPILQAPAKTSDDEQQYTNPLTNYRNKW